MCLPDLKTMRIVRNYLLGDCFCMLCTDCVTNQQIEYSHVLFVVRAPAKEPNFAVAAEVNTMAAMGREIVDRMRAEGKGEQEVAATAAMVGSHYLGVFPGDGHRNLGASDDWADLEKFSGRALEVVAAEFAITSAPIERPVLTPQEPARKASPPAAVPPSSGKRWWQFWK